MARVNDVTIRLLADVTKLKTGFSSAGQSVRQLSSQIQGLTSGQIKLTAAGRFYDNQKKQFISTAKAEHVITKALQREYTRTQTAVTAVANATKAAVQAEMEKVNASKSLAQISKETIAMYSASGNAVQHLTAKIVGLTHGEYLLTASGKILSAATKEEVAITTAAAAAVELLAAQQAKLRGAYDVATAGMTAQQKALLDTQMGITGLASVTGSASFAVISMGQIFQDMGQFGMGAAQGVRAITNNVQQTVQSLVLLSAITGQNESVWASFTKALRGPMGFLVAFSFVTGAIEFFTNRAQRAKKAASDLKDEFASFVKVAGQADGPGSITTSVEILADGIKKGRERIAQIKEELDAIGDKAQVRVNENGKLVFFQNEYVAGLKKEKLDLETAVKLGEDRLNIKNEEVRLADLIIDKQRQINYEIRQGEFEARQAQIRKQQEHEEYLDDVSREFAYEIAAAAKINTFVERRKEQQEEIRAALFAQKEAIAFLQQQLTFLEGPDGRRLSALRLQSEELEKQVEFQSLLNDIAARGISVAGPGDVGLTPRFVGMEGVQNMVSDIFFSAAGVQGPDRRFDAFSIMGQTDMALRMNEDMKKITEQNKKHAEEYKKHVDDIERENARLANSYNQMGADLLAAAVSFSGGADAFARSFGQFLSGWGKKLIQFGLAQAGFGRALQKLREAMLDPTPRGAAKAIIAGLAVVALGKMLQASARRASNPAGGDRGVSGGFIAPSFGSGGAFTIGNSSSAASFGGFSPAMQTSQPVHLVASGRSLVSVVNSETSAASRRIGGSFINLPGAAAASGIFIDINRDDRVI